jgi:hypothetical protein
MIELGWAVRVNVELPLDDVVAPVLGVTLADEQAPENKATTSSIIRSPIAEVALLRMVRDCAGFSF